jgi:hypothetical protein
MEGTKRVVVTPAGRRQYLEVLASHLDSQKASFDERHLWMNTDDAADQECMAGLAARHPWIRIVRHPRSEPSLGNFNIHWFFEGCVCPDTVYIRLNERWLACKKPRELGRVNVIFGKACCVHYAFHTQRPGLDSTDILAQYAKLTGPAKIKSGPPA